MGNGDDYNGNQLIGVCAAFLVFTYVSVILRCFVRIRITRAFSIDDWFMVTAQGIFTVSCIFVLRGVSYGIGKHNTDVLSQDDQIQAMKYQSLATVSYIANMTFIKLSVAIFLLRIAVKKVYIYILQASMVIVTVWSVVIFFYDIFQCSPVGAQWNFTITDAKCISGEQFVGAALSISIMSIVTDWLYALLPIPMIWNVQMTKQAKITVVFILSLGIFASVATLVRLKYLVDLTTDHDILYRGTEAMVWTLVEPGVAIIAASLVTVRPLLRTLDLSGFEDSGEGVASHTRSRYSRYALNNEPTLRPDIPSGGERWMISSVSTRGEKEMSRKKERSRSRFGGFRGTRVVVQEEEDNIGSDGIEMAKDAGAWSQEVIMEGLAKQKAARGGSIIGVTKTVDVVNQDRNSKILEPC